MMLSKPGESKVVITCPVLTLMRAIRLVCATPLTFVNWPPTNTLTPSPAGMTSHTRVAMLGTNDVLMAPLELKAKMLFRVMLGPPLACTRVKLPPATVTFPTVAIPKTPPPSSTIGVQSTGLVDATRSCCMPAWAGIIGARRTAAPSPATILADHFITRAP